MKIIFILCYVTTKTKSLDLYFIQISYLNIIEKLKDLKLMSKLFRKTWTPSASNNST